MADLSLWLDSYNDIYSDFDNRNYNHRRISDDFLHELRVALKYGDEYPADLLLFLPKEGRMQTRETVIINSLHNLFITRLQHHRDRSRKKILHAAVFGFTGLGVIIFNAWISYGVTGPFSIHALKLLLEPAGWFLVWVAFDWLFYDLSVINREKYFYKKLSGINIHFKDA